MRKKMIVTLLLFSMLLGGCSEKKEKYEDVDMSLVENQNPASLGEGNAEASNGDAMSLDEADDIYQNDTSLSFEIRTAYDSTLTISNMEVKNLIGSNPKVYEVDAPEISDEEIRELSSKLFDDGKYEVLTPYVACDTGTLKEELGYLNQFSQSDMYGDNELWREIISNRVVEVERLISGEYPSFPTQREAGQIQVAYTSIAEEYQEREMMVPPQTISKALLRGNVDGEPWMLEVWNYYPKSELSVDHQTEIYAYNLLKIHGAAFHEGDPFVKKAENMDDEGKALDASDTLLQKIGFSSAEKISTSGIARYPVYDPEENGFVQGYEFTYSFWDEDVPAYYFTREACYTAGDEGFLCQEISPRSCMEPLIKVDTRGGKVESIHITNYMPKREVLSENVNLIQKEQLLEKLGIYLEQYWVSSKDGWETALEQDELYDYCTLKLQYVLVPSSDGNGVPHYNLIPVWVCGWYIEDESNFETVMFGVQAIDGSCVNFTQGQVQF